VAINVGFDNAILVTASAVLIYVAARDLKDYKIPNELILLLLGLFLVHTLLLGRWRSAAWGLALAAIVLLFLILFYARHWIGGGDAKLLTIAFLWTGIEYALVFALLLLVFAFLHSAAAKLGWVRSRRLEGDGPPAIAFAPSVAAALICVFIWCAASPA
jgi:prepilin peptidase CpaA